MDKIKNLGKYAKKGNIPWNKGLKGFGKKFGFQKKEKNINWKGKDASLPAIHLWVKIRLPKPKLCQHCHKKPPYDLANKSGKYLRDLNDWEWLCRICHMKSDKRLEKLANYTKINGL
jgi:hypothetical protein